MGSLAGRDASAASHGPNRAAFETLQGIAWMLLVFFAFALIAYVIVRIGEMRGEARTMGKPSDPQN